MKSDNRDKKAELLAEAAKMAHEIGPQNMTAAALCEAAGIAPGSFGHIMGQTFAEFVAGMAEHDAPIALNRAQPQYRKASILANAVQVARSGHYMSLTRDKVAAAAGISGPTVLHYFKTMGELKAAVMAEALREGFLDIIAQGLACNDRHALTAPREMKQLAAELIAEK